jgi:hypothetical protein
MSRFQVGRLIAAAVLLLSACNRSGQSSMAEVYAGPATLPLRAEINPKSKVVGTVHHGEKLYVIERWRRLYHVRTDSNLSGWTPERNLMSTEQMTALKHLEESSRKLPSQGVATTFEPLNVHTEPSRYAAAFVQITQGQKFDVIGHKLSPRKQPAPRVLIKPRPKPEPGGRRRADRKKLLIPPLAAPKPPADWEELSKQRSAPKQDETDDDAEAENVPLDDWTLVRTSGGSVGWVLTSRVYMAIPDDVAQYAEGRRIVSYFPLGKVHDDERGEKNYWLWTTVGSGQHPYDFDGFRVFTWNPKRHRYETAYIQRKVEGYLPVLVDNKNGQYTFSLCLAQEDGSTIRKSYALVDRLVKSGDAQPCKPAEDMKAVASPDLTKTPEAGKHSLLERLKEKAGDLKKRITGR